MELVELIAAQIDRDRRHGFPVTFESDSEREQQLAHDLIGLVGEVGEFSNLLKKVMLAKSIAGYLAPTIGEATPALREELADASIYIFRLMTILGGDLEREILAKMKINDERYRHLDR